MGLGAMNSWYSPLGAPPASRVIHARAVSPRTPQKARAVMRRALLPQPQVTSDPFKPAPHAAQPRQRTFVSAGSQRREHARGLSSTRIVGGQPPHCRLRNHRAAPPYCAYAVMGPFRCFPKHRALPPTPQPCAASQVSTEPPSKAERCH